MSTVNANETKNVESFVEIKMNEGCEDLFPVKAHESDAGFDLMAAEDVTLGLNEVKAVSVGFKMAMEDGWEAQIRSRSGLGLKGGVRVGQGIGTIDSGFRGEIKVILRFSGTKPYVVSKTQIDDHTYSENFISISKDQNTTFSIKRGDKIAQMVIKRVPMVKLVKVNSLSETERGEGGFGSTDKKVQ